MRINATRKAGGSVRSQTAARSAAHTCWICSSTSRSQVEFDVLPGRLGVGRDDLHRLVELLAEPGGQVGVAVDDGVHGVVQPVGVERAGDGHVELHRIQVTEILSGAGVEEQSLLEGGQRQDVGDAVLLLQLVDLVLGQPGRGDVGGGQAAAAASDVGADAGQGVKPQLAEPADLRLIQCGGRPGPGGVQVWAGVGVDGAGVEFDGVGQRHGHRRGGVGDRQAVLADPPQVAGDVGVGCVAAEASEVVESDRRVGPGQVDVGVEVAQQSVGQGIGQGAQLFFGVS